MIDPEDGQRYLGVRLSPTGNIQQQLEYIIQMARECGYIIRKAHINKEEARRLHDRIWMPRISYSLHHTTFSEEECWCIESVSI